MNFEISERIQTSASKDDILNELNNQFKKEFYKVTRTGETLELVLFKDTFGSGLRKEITIIEIFEKDKGYLLVANVRYTASVSFWILVIIMLFTYVFWIVPILGYLYHKNSAKKKIQMAFSRIKIEFYDSTIVQSIKNENKEIHDVSLLEKFELFRQKGVITEEEFQAKKNEILGL